MTYQPQPSSSQPVRDRFQTESITSSFLPPPNITGPLHLGHAFNQSLTDTFLRNQFQKCSDRTLWVAGLDHAGIASQIIVNKILTEREPSISFRPGCLSENIWEWYFVLKWTTSQQSKPFRLSFDWLKGHFTFNTRASNCLREVISQLDVRCLVYRTERLINWDSNLGTVLSDLEVECQSQSVRVWYLKYLRPASCCFLVVCTARPETLTSDSAILTNPHDREGKRLGSSGIVIPTSGRTVPIVFYPQISVGIGIRLAAPAYHEPRHHRPAGSNLRSHHRDSKLRQVQSATRAGWQELLGLKFGGSLLFVGNQKVSATFSSRTLAPAVLVLMRQWFLKLREASSSDRKQQTAGLTLSEVALEAVRTRRTRFLPAKWLGLSCRWLRATEDWCLSRQLLWGHRIPSRLSETEGDVLDTWFSSATIPISASQPAVRFSDPRGYLPFSVLFTGYDIVHFWVTRLLMVSSYCTSKVPVSLVYVHSLFCGSDGTKMSKSKGNVIVPSDFLRVQSKPQTGRTVGSVSDADSFRSVFTSLASPGWDITFDHSKLGSYRSFLLKIANVGSFLTAKWLGLKARLPVVRTSLVGLAVTALGRRVASEFQEAVTSLSKNRGRIRLDRQLEDVYRFSKKKCCDRFIEHIKASTDVVACHPKNSDLLALSVLFGNLLQLLYPIAPTTASALLNENDRRLHRLGRFSNQVHPSSNLVAVNSLRDVHKEKATTELLAISKILREASSSIPNRKGTLLVGWRHEHLVEASIDPQLTEIFVFTDWPDLAAFCGNSCKPIAGSPQVQLLFKQTPPSRKKKEGSRATIRRLLSVPFVCHSRLDDVLTAASHLNFLPATD